MSFLSDKRELKKAAKELTLVKLNEAIEVLNAVVAERQKEAELISQLEQLAKTQGFTLEQLGYTLNNEPLKAASTDTEVTDSKPTRPKFKTINKDSQYFYIENGQLKLLRTHTMKKGLEQRGIDIVPIGKVDKKYAKQIDALLAEATKQAVDSYNAKIDGWNVWAAENNGEILQKK